MCLPGVSTPSTSSSVRSLRLGGFPAGGNSADRHWCLSRGVTGRNRLASGRSLRGASEQREIHCKTGVSPRGVSPGLDLLGVSLSLMVGQRRGALTDRSISLTDNPFFRPTPPLHLTDRRPLLQPTPQRGLPGVAELPRTSGVSRRPDLESPTAVGTSSGSHYSGPRSSFDVDLSAIESLWVTEILSSPGHHWRWPPGSPPIEGWWEAELSRSGDTLPQSQARF